MKKIDSLWFTLVSEMLVNLAAAWIGAAILTLFSAESSLLLKFITLTLNIISAIVSMLAAYWFRKRGKK